MSSHTHSSTSERSYLNKKKLHTELFGSFFLDLGSDIKLDLAMDRGCVFLGQVLSVYFAFESFRSVFELHHAYSRSWNLSFVFGRCVQAECVHHMFGLWAGPRIFSVCVFVCVVHLGFVFVLYLCLVVFFRPSVMIVLYVYFFCFTFAATEELGFSRRSHSFFLLSGQHPVSNSSPSFSLSVSASRLSSSFICSFFWW